MRSWVVGAVVLGSCVAARAEGPRPAIRVRLDHPDRQLQSVLGLFRGARSPHPAAALANWRRATGKTLGKPIEAAIAALNPEMVAELRGLHEAEVVVGFGPGGEVRWHARFPRDDGSVAALATALVLTDGGRDEPIGGLEVDRLGPPGSPLLARDGRGVVLAGTREDLVAALAATVSGGASNPDDGLRLRLDPLGLGAGGSLGLRRAAEALRGLGCTDLDANVRFLEDSAAIHLAGRFASTPPGRAIDPDWLDWVPAKDAVAAVAVGLDPSREAWDRVFAVADLVEKADPSRAGLAPMRVRLDTIALSLGVRPERDLWPRLRGLTAAWLTGERGLIALHAIDDPSAERLAAILPRLARRLGFDCDVDRRGATVILARGEGALTASLGAGADLGRSAGPIVRAGWGGSPPERAGAFWVGRWPGVAESLAEAPPVLWTGRRDGMNTREELSWADLDDSVRRILDTLPTRPAS